MEVLGFHVKVESYRDILKHISHRLTVKKSSLKPLGILKEASREHAVSVGLDSHSAVHTAQAVWAAWSDWSAQGAEARNCEHQ